MNVTVLRIVMNTMQLLGSKKVPRGRPESRLFPGGGQEFNAELSSNTIIIINSVGLMARWKMELKISSGDNMNRF